MSPSSETSGGCRPVAYEYRTIPILSLRSRAPRRRAGAPTGRTSRRYRSPRRHQSDLVERLLEIPLVRHRSNHYAGRGQLIEQHAPSKTRRLSEPEQHGPTINTPLGQYATLEGIDHDKFVHRARQSAGLESTVIVGHRFGDPSLSAGMGTSLTLIPLTRVTRIT